MMKIAVEFQIGLWLTALHELADAVVVVGDLGGGRVVAGADALGVVVHQAHGHELRHVFVHGGRVAGVIGLALLKHELELAVPLREPARLVILAEHRLGVQRTCLGGRVAVGIGGVELAEVDVADARLAEVRAAPPVPGAMEPPG